jgi:hypothetical protein
VRSIHFAAGEVAVIRLTLNGVTTVDYREEDEAIARAGIIALQVHAGGPMRVEFRKLRIRELPAR